MSRRRVEAAAICPYCGCKDWYSFQVQSDELICDYCNKVFEIDLDVSVVITATRAIE